MASTSNLRICNEDITECFKITIHRRFYLLVTCLRPLTNSYEYSRGLTMFCQKTWIQQISIYHHPTADIQWEHVTWDKQIGVFSTISTIALSTRKKWRKTIDCAHQHLESKHINIKKHGDSGSLFNNNYKNVMVDVVDDGYRLTQMTCCFEQFIDDNFMRAVYTWLRFLASILFCNFISNNTTSIHKNIYRLLDILLVECWLRVREVPGSVSSQWPRHTKDVAKMVLVVHLFSTQHWKGKYWHFLKNKIRK